MGAALRPLLKILLFSGFNVALIIGWLYATNAYVERNKFTNENCDSNLLFMPEGQKFDLLLLGASHAREFSLSGNHQRVEKILNQRMINLARGNGAGIVPMEIYLSRFYDRGNTATTVLYMIDPFVFHSSNYNEENSYINPEPFDWDFARRILQRGGGMPGVLAYVQSKFRHTWVLLKPNAAKINDGTVTTFLEEHTESRMENLYHRGTSDELFRRYTKHLETLIRMAQEHGSRVIFVIPPTLMGTDPGSAALLGFLEQTRSNSGIPYYDRAHSLTQPKFYFNVDHLNTAGICQFTEQYLKPILTQ